MLGDYVHGLLLRDEAVFPPLRLSAPAPLQEVLPYFLNVLLAQDPKHRDRYEITTKKSH